MFPFHSQSAPRRHYHTGNHFQTHLSQLYKVYPATLDVEHSTQLTGHSGCVNALGFSSDGSLLVSGSDDMQVKIWDYENQKCLQTLHGHISNVFATIFPVGDNSTVISGSNDSDIRIYDVEKKSCTVLRDHRKKVLCIKGDPWNPNLFLSCSSDGSVRMFDLREKYQNSRYEGPQDQEDLERNYTGQHRRSVIPQSLGGGRMSEEYESLDDGEKSLVVQYSGESGESSLYSLDIHPRNHHQFIVSGEDENVRLFDCRKIEKHQAKNYVNIYRAVDQIRPSRHCSMTGCQFNYLGTEIIASNLNSGKVYLFDTDKNYEKEYKVDYFAQPLIDSDDGEPQQLCPVDTFKASYEGHISRHTIKGVWFLGDRSQYVVSGSDNAYIFIWDKETKELVRVLKGHDEVVNSIVSLTAKGIVASAGIDDYVRIWKPGRLPDESERKKRKEEIEDVKEEAKTRARPTFAPAQPFNQLYQAILMHMRQQIESGGSGGPLFLPRNFLFADSDDDSMEDEEEDEEYDPITHGARQQDSDDEED